MIEGIKDSLSLYKLFFSLRVSRGDISLLCSDPEGTGFQCVFLRYESKCKPLISSDTERYIRSGGTVLGLG